MPVIYRAIRKFLDQLGVSFAVTDDTRDHFIIGLLTDIGKVKVCVFVALFDCCFNTRFFFSLFHGLNMCLLELRILIWLSNRSIRQHKSRCRILLFNFYFSHLLLWCFFDYEILLLQLWVHKERTTAILFGHQFAELWVLCDLLVGFRDCIVYWNDESNTEIARHAHALLVLRLKLWLNFELRFLAE